MIRAHSIKSSLGDILLLQSCKVCAWRWSVLGNSIVCFLFQKIFSFYRSFISLQIVDDQLRANNSWIFFKIVFIAIEINRNYSGGDIINDNSKESWPTSNYIKTGKCKKNEFERFFFFELFAYYNYKLLLILDLIYKIKLEMVVRGWLNNR